MGWAQIRKSYSAEIAKRLRRMEKRGERHDEKTKSGKKREEIRSAVVDTESVVLDERSAGVSTRQHRYGLWR